MSSEMIDEKGLEAAVLAHDKEEAAMMGEPDPWENERPEPEFSDRKFAMGLGISAYLAQVNAQPVAVKPLVWEEGEAHSPVGIYRVHCSNGMWEPVHRGTFMLPREYGTVAAFGTEQEAKDFVQNHYECLVRSALVAEPAPQPVDERLASAKRRIAGLERERDKERKHVARLMRDLEHNRQRAENAEAKVCAASKVQP